MLAYSLFVNLVMLWLCVLVLFKRASLSTFRTNLTTIERERAERQKADLEADMEGRG